MIGLEAGATGLKLVLDSYAAAATSMQLVAAYTVAARDSNHSFA